MSTGEDDFRIRPGKGRDGGAANMRRATRLAAQVKRAAMRGGQLRRAPAKRLGVWSQHVMV